MDPELRKHRLGLRKIKDEINYELQVLMALVAYNQILNQSTLIISLVYCTVDSSLVYCTVLDCSIPVISSTIHMVIRVRIDEF